MKPVDFFLSAFLTPALRDIDLFNPVLPSHETTSYVDVGSQSGLKSYYETRNLSVVRAREPPWLATSATERPLPRAAAGTVNEHLAAEPSQTRRTFR